jgi:pSer/pThr/pTyr-binding forkhead associated (FHA) protein
MALLQRLADARQFNLLADTLVGRSSRCDLVLRHDSVSQTHASIRFLGTAWLLEDRNSKNGTWVNGECLSRSHGFRLATEQVIRFGAKGVEEWRLIDVSPPALSATGSSTARVSRCIREARLVIHGDLNLEMTAGLLTHRLKGRVPYLVLQALAKERLEDRSRGRSPDDEGWLDRRSLAERLRHRDINQDIHRIRQDFQRLGVFEDPDAIVEDQREQSKVRLGVYDVALL